VYFERSLVVLKNYLGDTVMASPLIRSVVNASGATDILGAPIVEQLLRFPDFRARFYDPGKLSNIGQFFRMARQVREGQYEAAFLVNRSFRSALLVRMAGIKKRIGHATEGRSWLLTERVPYDPTKNEAECYLDLFTQATKLTPSVTNPALFVFPEEQKRAVELLDGATVGIQAGARHDYKQVPLKIWHEVGQALIRDGQRLAFFGGPEERTLLGELQLPGVDLVGKTTIRETIGALSCLKAMIGGDTGVPTITAFGQTPAEKWGWYTPPHQVVRSPDNNIRKLDAKTLIESTEKVLCALR
jgi:heptosyltransferase-2